MSALHVFCLEPHAVSLGVMLRFLHELRSVDLRAVGTSSPLTALDLAAPLQPHVLLLSLSAAHDDLALISSLRDRLPDVTMIVLGLLDLDQYRRAVCQAGADGFVAKAELAGCLERLMQRAYQQHCAAVCG